MINKKQLTIFMILMCIHTINHSVCKVETMEGPAPYQVCADIKCLRRETFVEAHLNQRLFYGLSGNGRRLVAKHYAEKTNGLLIEHSSSEIVCGYKKEGTPFLTNLIRNAIEEATNANKIAILYISDIDEVKRPSNHEQRLNHEASMMDQRAALEMLRMESIKYNTEGSKVFVIFTAQDLSNVHQLFISRLNGPIIEFANPDYTTRQRIFNKYFLEQDGKELLKSKLSTQTVTEFENEIAEITKLEESLNKLDAKFWEEKAINDKSWFDQENFTQTMKDAHKLSMNLSDLCNKLAQKWLDKFNEEKNTNKQYYAIQQELYDTKNRSYKNQAFMYSNHDLFAKAYNQTRTRYSGRFVEQIAKIIIKAAIIGNKGLVTREIMEGIVNKVEQPDPLLLGLGIILTIDKAFDDATRR